MPLLALAPIVPSPAHTTAAIHFVLPSAGDVTLAIHDVQGRRVAAPIDHVTMTAGPHVIDVDTSRLRPGAYVFRLRRGSQSVTQTMIVAP